MWEKKNKLRQRKGNNVQKYSVLIKENKVSVDPGEAVPDGG